MTNNLINFVIPFSEEIQKIENSLYDLKTKRGLTTAEGAQLDIIGEIVGEDRNGKSDIDYLAAINLRIELNTNAGKVNPIVQFIKAKTESDTVKWVESYPAGVIIYLNGYVVVSTPSSFGNIFKDIKSLLPTGVVLRSLRYVNDNYEPFALSELDYSPEPSGSGFLELSYDESHGYTAGALTESAQ